MPIDPRVVLAGVTAVTLGTVAFVHQAQKDDEKRMREAVHKDIVRQKEKRKRSSKRSALCAI